MVHHPGEIARDVEWPEGITGIFGHTYKGCKRHLSLRSRCTRGHTKRDAFFDFDLDTFRSRREAYVHVHSAASSGVSQFSSYASGPPLDAHSSRLTHPPARSKCPNRVHLDRRPAVPSEPCHGRARP